MKKALQTPDVEAVIVGAGFSGLYQLHMLRKQGLSARVIERASDVGGTWYWNRYPGARCDVPSLAYSISYLPELDQEWKWREAFACQADILEYIKHIAERLDLYRDITLRTQVDSAIWDEAANYWTIETDRGDIVTSRYLIMATGALTVPKTPALAGLESFNGRWFHTGRWPHEPIDFGGRRVAVVGTGSTGIQVISTLGEIASELIVFQRTPKFTVPVGNHPLTDDELRKAKVEYPAFRRACRWADFGYPVSPIKGMLTEFSVAEREALMEARWEAGTFPSLLLGYQPHMGIVNPEVNELLTEFARNKIREIVKDPVVAETLTPRGYPLGVNRLCRDTNYYQMFNRGNVRLIDTRTDPIMGIKPTGMLTASGVKECDDIIFATGYDAITGAITSINVKGIDGVTIRESWKDGPHTYLGLAVSGYPNLFLITGPGGPSVLSNVIVTSEQNVEFITGLIAHMKTNRFETAQPTADADRNWMEHVAQVAQQSLFREAHKANAWYTGKNVPGKRVVFMPYAGGVGTYGSICDEIARDGYRGFQFKRREPSATYESPTRSRVQPTSIK